MTGVTNVHSGTSPTQAEVINLTRNIVITSYNTTYRGYIYCPLNSTSDVDYVEFYMLGHNSSTKHGVEIRTTAAVATNFSYCSVWGNAASNSSFYLYQAQNVVIDNCVIYNVDEEFYIYSSILNTISNNIVIGCTDYGLRLNQNQNTITGNTFTSNSSYGINAGGSDDFTSFSSNISHSNGSYGLYISNGKGVTISYFTGWRNNNTGLYLGSCSVILNNIVLFGNNVYNIVISASSVISGDTWNLNGDTTYPTLYGIRFSNNCPCGFIKDALFGVASGILSAHATADIYCSSGAYASITLTNAKLDSPTNVADFDTTIIGSYIQCEDLGQVAYADKAWYRNGIVVRDATTYKYSSYAARFDYQANNAAWLEYETYIPVKDGEQIVASAWLRKNASYTDANRPKITISGQGITEDSDQMSDVTDTWERVTVTGTPTRTGLAKLTISTYLVNVGASAWVDFQKTDILSGVLNTIEGDFWANGHIAEVFMDTGSITAKEFWSTLTADVNTTASFGKLLKDYIDAAISGRAPANEYDTQMAYIPSNLSDVPTDSEL
ncbi:MAG: right-handed parallel beta-helix repeat-containing protein, partial [Candidatus Pacebacteria bacterium]|nr:right-handed parallel beta-helix repeat-containing protein [Candidatus Paceibacterota bacterium]